jgi:transmembrane sensor
MSSDSQQARGLRAASEAARWLMLLQTGELSSEQRSEFIDWLRESPLHVAEMLHMCRLHRDLLAFTKWQQIAQVAAPAPASDAMVVPFPLQHLEPPGRIEKRRQRRPLLIAAAVAILALISALVLVDADQSAVRTQAGERREITLIDGSVVDLAPNSDLRVRFDPKQRFVSLERGEALFHVAKNPSRPFIVEAGDTRVRAVGTAFSVARKSTEVSVTVVEGRVTVSQTPSLVRRLRSTSSTGPAEVALGADQQVVFSPTQGAAPVQQVNGEVEIAWSNGYLLFDNESIGKIAERFNSYNRVQIRILDPELAKRKVSGMFKATDPESFAAFVESEIGPRIQHEPDVIVLGAPQRS